ncbi:hypothetical protein EVA_11918 [gut metagenome]|uniref:Uncharacterized protein n=1 Tax=gut metagenome TaxID=749906 RepID=J9CIS2_9ZZZZ
MRRKTSRLYKTQYSFGDSFSSIQEFRKANSWSVNSFKWSTKNADVNGNLNSGRKELTDDGLPKLVETDEGCFM